jgi:hypothetical protein
VFKDCVSDMAVESKKLGNRTRETAVDEGTVKQAPGF